MAISLVAAGRSQRVFDDYRRQRDADAFLKNSRDYALEQQQWAREDRGLAQEDRTRRIALEDLQRQGLERQAQVQRYQLADLERQDQRRNTAGEALKSGNGLAGSWLQVAEALKGQGDVEGYTQYMNAYRLAKQEGMGELARAALMGATPEELVAINNRYGDNRDVASIEVEDVLDAAGRLSDRRLVATKANGQRSPVMSARAVLVGLGLMKPDEYAYGENVGIYNKGTGQVTTPATGKPKDYMIELRRSDGSTYLVDARDPSKVVQAQNEAAAAAGISKETADRMWKALLSGKGEFDSLQPDAQKLVWDGYNNGLAIVRQYPNVDPGQAAIYGYRLATGELTEQQLMQQLGQPAAAPGAGAGAGGGAALPPVPEGAPQGAKYVRHPQSGEPVLVVERNGKLYPVVQQPDEPAAAAAPAPSRPTLSDARPAAPAAPKPAAAPAERDVLTEGEPLEATNPRLKQLGDQVRFARMGGATALGSRQAVALAEYARELERIRGEPEAPTVKAVLPTGEAPAPAALSAVERPMATTPEDVADPDAAALETQGGTPAPAPAPAPLEGVRQIDTDPSRRPVPVKGSKQARNELEKLDKKLADLRTRIEQAQKAGRQNEAKRLRAEFSKLTKRYEALQSDLPTR